MNNQTTAEIDIPPRRAFFCIISSEPNNGVTETMGLISQLISKGYQFKRIKLKGYFIVRPSYLAKEKYTKVVIKALAEKEVLCLNWLNCWVSQTYLPSSQFKIDFTSKYLAN